MSDQSRIEWTDATWNPVTGCTKVSAGCDHCYAETLHERFNGKGSFATVTPHPDRLEKPVGWRKPRRVFVNSMSDLFHKDVPDRFIAKVFHTMGTSPQHTFQVLTKRPGRMRALLNSVDFVNLMIDVDRKTGFGSTKEKEEEQARLFIASPRWPLPNVWLGVSTEDQKWADIRIPALLDTPAAVRWISAEPLLGPVTLNPYWLHGAPEWGPEYREPTSPTGLLVQDLVSVKPQLDWVVVGGESGPGARPMHPAWARSLRDQCASANVPFLFKQWGKWCPPAREFGQSPYDHVTNEDACQVVSAGGELLGRPWPGWAVQDGTRDAHVMRSYRKTDAGRVLDDRIWDEYPAVTA
ncbi:DUF5131 family protein [Amycolatopsis sp. CA-161197]|uniref:DUF5131 family protein n=1 Tax=Amycolatopsis sp. CA-161197 TaxID=3239922 RepID=UPI003D9298F5